jgi:hypothetical protein
MTLREARCAFTALLPLLIRQAHALGLECAAGEVQRDPRTALLNAKTGKGIANSVHLQGLAIDLHLYRGGRYLTQTEDHQQLGEWWERQHPLARWGGRWGDGNHYSFEWQGRK